MFESDEYKGHPVVKLSDDTMKYPFTFGLKKARLILDHFTEIEEWVTEQENLAGIEEDGG